MGLAMADPNRRYGIFSGVDYGETGVL